MHGVSFRLLGRAAFTHMRSLSGELVGGLGDSSSLQAELVTISSLFIYSYGCHAGKLLFAWLYRMVKLAVRRDIYRLTGRTKPASVT